MTLTIRIRILRNLQIFSVIEDFAKILAIEVKNKGTVWQPYEKYTKELTTVVFLNCFRNKISFHFSKL